MKTNSGGSVYLLDFFPLTRGTAACRLIDVPDEVEAAAPRASHAKHFTQCPAPDPGWNPAPEKHFAQCEGPREPEGALFTQCETTREPQGMLFTQCPDGGRRPAPEKHFAQCEGPREPEGALFTQCETTREPQGMHFTQCEIDSDVTGSD